jgi:hypothetical protein
MRDIENITQKLRKGYTPQSENAKGNIAKIYDQTFDPLVRRKELDVFFEIYKKEDPILKAWAFLGIYKILERKSYETQKNKERLHEIILDILDDRREITYFSGSIETKVSLREHHALRISWLHPDLVFEPVFEYVKSSITNFDKVISQLIEDVLSQKSDPRVEELLLKFATNTKKHQLFARQHIINAFENIGRKMEIQNKTRVETVFKNFLQEAEGTSNETKERILRDSIIEVAAKLGLNLEKETMDFLGNLDRPYNAMNVIAERYKGNDKLNTILLEKLDDTNNKHFVGDILRAIIVIKDEIPNWEEIVMKNVNEYQLNDTDLIIALTESGVLNQGKLIKYFKEANDWQLEFVREFLNTHPELIDSWTEFREEFISILKQLESKENNFLEKKKLVFSVIIDLNWTKMAEYCVENFIHLDNEKLRRMALFISIRFGNDEIWKNLRQYMDKDEEIKEYVTKFWKQLERRDWNFYY